MDAHTFSRFCGPTALGVVVGLHPWATARLLEDAARDAGFTATPGSTRAQDMEAVLDRLGVHFEPWDPFTGERAEPTVRLEDLPPFERGQLEELRARLASDREFRRETVGDVDRLGSLLLIEWAVRHPRGRWLLYTVKPGRPGVSHVTALVDGHLVNPSGHEHRGVFFAQRIYRTPRPLPARLL